MSISDLIVVMKDGVIQQIGKPQEVYEKPANLFVAKFLGTPPINCFDARVEGGKLFIGQEAVLEADAPDGAVIAAIRPEGFDPEPDGAFPCDLTRVEVMGRDISVVCTHSKSQNDTIRAIISSENLPDVTGSVVRFNLKPNKVFLFHSETGDRIHY